MTEVCLAVIAAYAGFRLSVVGHAESFTAPKFRFHVAILMSGTLALFGFNALVFPLAAWLPGTLTGAWFTGLAIVYTGHALAIWNWGEPMNRAIFLFGLRRFPHFARLKPQWLAPGVMALAAIFTLSWWSVKLDNAWLARDTRIALGFAGAAACVVYADFLRRATKFPVSADLLLGVIRGGVGPQAAPPPYNPALGERCIPRDAPVPARKPTVVIIVIDSARARNMSIHGYDRPTTPFLDSLRDRGARVAPLTVASGASSDAGLWAIFSSRRVRHQSVNAPCLHDLLIGAGFSARVFCSGTIRFWRGLDYLFGPNLDVLTSFEDEMIDAQMPLRASNLPVCQGLGDFLFFHMMSVHSAPGASIPEVWTPSQHRFTRGGGGTLDEAARRPYVNHYDNAMRQADTYVAQVLDALKAKGYLEDAIVVVTSDHGEHVLERTPALVGHGRSMYQESVHVPLLIWDTQRDLPEPAALADHTDIAPTILESIGLAAPAAWQGSSIFSGARRTTHAEHLAGLAGSPQTHMEAVISLLPQGVYKTIHHRLEGREVLTQTFCLSTDPGELTDLSGQLAPEVEAALERDLREYREQPSLVVRTTWRHLDNAQ